jgi:hypothetical protein
MPGGNPSSLMTGRGKGKDHMQRLVHIKRRETKVKEERGTPIGDRRIGYWITPHSILFSFSIPIPGTTVLVWPMSPLLK